MYENFKLVYLNAHICIFDIDFLQIFLSIKVNCLTVHRKLTWTESEWIPILKLCFSKRLPLVATLSKEIIKSLRDSMPPWHWSNFSDQVPRTLWNRKAHTEYLFQRGKLTDLWQDVEMELSQLFRGHRHCPVTSQLCKYFCFRADNSIPFHHSSGPSSGWWRKLFSVQQKTIPHGLSQLWHILKKQSQLVHRRGPSTFCLPTPSTPQRHYKNRERESKPWMFRMSRTKGVKDRGE